MAPGQSRGVAAAAGQKRQRRRQREAPVGAGSSDDPAWDTSEEDEEDEEEQPAPPRPRKRGRPRKDAAAPAAAAGEGDDDSDTANYGQGVKRALRAQVELEPARIKAMRNFFKNKIKDISWEEWEAMTPGPELGPLWTARDEQVLQRHWERDPLRSFLAAKDDWNYRVTLCKLVSALYRTTPEAMISLEHNFAHDYRGNGMVEVGGEKRKNPLWSSTFCRAFAEVACHAFFKRRPALLITAIQYAVICRVNDARPWVPDHFRLGDYFLQKFHDALAAAAGKKEQVPDIRKAVEKAHAATWKTIGRSDWAVLSEEIEKLAWRPATTRRFGYAAPDETHAPHWVTHRDMANVRDAVGATHGMMGHPGPWECDVWYLVVHAGMNKGGYPNKPAGFKPVVLWAALRDKRLRAMKALRGEPVPYIPGDPTEELDAALHEDLARGRDDGDSESERGDWGADVDLGND